MAMTARLKHTRILMTATCLLETKELASALRLSESFLRADYHPSLLCSHMDQWSLLPYNLPPRTPLSAYVHTKVPYLYISVPEEVDPHLHVRSTVCMHARRLVAAKARRSAAQRSAG